MNNPRLVFVGLYNDTNLGDPIIAGSTEWLFSQFIDLKEKVIRLPLFPTFSIYSRIRRKIKRSISASLGKKDYEYSLYKYYSQNIRKGDVIVTTGGGLIKYKFQECDLALANLLKAASKKQAIVIFNSVGVEGYDTHSLRCQNLKIEIIKAIQNNTLRYISTRDDIQTLKEKYLNNLTGIPCIKVADPAVWCAEAYNITPKSSNRTIGIGIIRSNIFIDYGISFSEERVYHLYMEMIKLLKIQGHDIILFTNGLNADNLFAQKIQNALKDEENIQCELYIPQSASELIHSISQFKGIIAGRLHSCIIAYSLNIPAIGLVWNDKLTLFGKNIGAEENFITHEYFSPSYIVTQLQTAIQKGYNQDIAQTFKQTIKDSIKEITQLYLN